MAFELGKVAGGYEFIDVFSKVKTGLAYKVRNVKCDRLEMLRILPQNMQGDQERVDRFLREIKVHARLGHPNIITFYNATEIDSHLVMTYEFFEAITLEERLEQ